MNASELRIGSIVKEGTIKSFYEHGIHLGYGKCIHFNDVEPEPITEEWLIKFGFVGTKSDTYISPKEWTLNIDDNVKFIAGGNIDYNLTRKMIVCTECNGTYVACNVGSVHQMQNIYHALTYGKEMMIAEVCPEVCKKDKDWYYYDVNETKLRDGDIIDISDNTVNGCDKFIVVTTNPIDIRYGYNLNRKYQYDMNELIDDSEFVIIGNIYDQITTNDKRGTNGIDSSKLG